MLEFTGDGVGGCEERGGRGGVGVGVGERRRFGRTRRTVSAGDGRAVVYVVVVFDFFLAAEVGIAPITVAGGMQARTLRKEYGTIGGTVLT